MFIVHTSNCHGQNCTTRAIYRLGIDTLIANILVIIIIIIIFFRCCLYNGMHFAEVRCQAVHQCTRVDRDVAGMMH